MDTSSIVVDRSPHLGGEQIFPGQPILDRHTKVRGVFIERRKGFYYCQMDDGMDGAYMRGEIRFDWTVDRFPLHVGQEVYWGFSTAPRTIISINDDGTLTTEVKGRRKDPRTAPQAEYALKPRRLKMFRSVSKAALQGLEP